MVASHWTMRGYEAARTSAPITDVKRGRTAQATAASPTHTPPAPAPPHPPSASSWPSSPSRRSWSAFRSSSVALAAGGGRRRRVLGTPAARPLRWPQPGTSGRSPLVGAIQEADAAPSFSAMSSHLSFASRAP